MLVIKDLAGGSCKSTGHLHDWRPGVGSLVIILTESCSWYQAAVGAVEVCAGIVWTHNTAAPVNVHWFYFSFIKFLLNQQFICIYHAPFSVIAGQNCPHFKFPLSVRVSVVTHTKVLVPPSCRRHHNDPVAAMKLTSLLKLEPILNYRYTTRTCFNPGLEFVINLCACIEIFYPFKTNFHFSNLWKKCSDISSIN